MRVPAASAILFIGLLIAAGVARAQTWAWTQTSAPNLPWTNIAMSADGNTLVAVTCGGNIYTSTNFGVNWVSNSIPNTAGTFYGWTSVASSANGNDLVAAAIPQNVCTSTNGGATWTWHPFGLQFHSIIMSADGTIIAGAIGGQGQGGGIYVSTNSGNTFNETYSGLAYYISSGANGRVMVGTGQADVFSTNYGMNWSNFGNFIDEGGGTRGAISADGRTIVVAARNGIQVSTNQGASYNYIPVETVETYFDYDACSAMSANGSKIFCALYYPPMADMIGSTNFFSSFNSFQTWTTNSAPSLFNFITCSADGNKLAAIGWTNAPYQYGGNYIYTACFSPSPQINLSLATNSVALSWIVPSTNMVMEESPDLNAWTVLTNSPVLDLTNLQEQLTVSPTNGAGFFRLVSQ